MARRECFRIAELDVFGGDDTWPFGAGAEEPAALSDDACGVEGAAGNEELHALADTEVGAEHSKRVSAIIMQRQHLDRVAEIVVIELMVPDAVKLYRRGRGHHEIERRA